MDKERIVGASPNWNKLKDIFYRIGLNVSHRVDTMEFISHGVMIIVDGKGLFLQMRHSYEYGCILHGSYTGVKLYHYLSLMNIEERMLLLRHPFEQWRMLYPDSNMPGDMYRKLRSLQHYLPILYEMIPIIGKSEYITIPKGRAHIGETSMDAALRELHEETGITIDPSLLSSPKLERIVGTDGNTYITYIYGVHLDDYPIVTVGQEFRSYMWLGCNDDILMMRQVRILQSFLHKVNVKHCNSKWLQQDGKARQCSLSHDEQEQVSLITETGETEMSYIEGGNEQSCTKGCTCSEVQEGIYEDSPSMSM